MNNWITDRPTKPGKYHVYVAPKNRSRLYPGYLIVTLDSHDLEDLDRNELYDGALWRPYVEPPDPFAEPVPSLRERVEALPDLVLGSGRVIGSAVDRGAVLALLETESQ